VYSTPATQMYNLQLNGGSMSQLYALHPEAGTAARAAQDRATFTRAQYHLVKGSNMLYYLRPCFY